MYNNSYQKLMLTRSDREELALVDIDVIKKARKFLNRLPEKA